MEIKINFPSPNDKIWNKVNAELEQIIPSIFSAHISTSDLSLKLDKWLHVFFVEQFGTLPAPKAELILIQKKKIFDCYEKLSAMVMGNE